MSVFDRRFRCNYRTWCCLSSICVAKLRLCDVGIDCASPKLGTEIGGEGTVIVATFGIRRLSKGNGLLVGVARGVVGSSLFISAENGVKGPERDDDIEAVESLRI